MKEKEEANPKYIQLLGEEKNGYNRRRTEAYIQKLENFCKDASVAVTELKKKIAAAENDGTSLSAASLQSERELKQVKAENAALRAQISELTAKLAEAGKQAAIQLSADMSEAAYSKDLIAQVLIDARTTADQIVEKAKKDADASIADAQERVHALQIIENDARSRITKVCSELASITEPLDSGTFHE